MNQKNEPIRKIIRTKCPTTAMMTVAESANDEGFESAANILLNERLQDYEKINSIRLLSHLSRHTAEKKKRVLEWSLMLLEDEGNAVRSAAAHVTYLTLLNLEDLSDQQTDLLSRRKRVVEALRRALERGLDETYGPIVARFINNYSL